MSTKKFQKNGNRKRHRDPPRLVCFGERIWIKIKEIIKEEPLERKKKDRRGKKEKTNSSNKAIDIPQVNGSKTKSFLLDGIKVNPWWERESWAMVTDNENPFGDLTREEQLRITELLKGIR